MKTGVGQSQEPIGSINGCACTHTLPIRGEVSAPSLEYAIQNRREGRNQITTWGGGEESNKEESRSPSIIPDTPPEVQAKKVRGGGGKSPQSQPRLGTRSPRNRRVRKKYTYKCALGCRRKTTDIVRHYQSKKHWMVGCFGFNGPLRQYFSLYRAASQREGEREEKG